MYLLPSLSNRDTLTGNYVKMRDSDDCLSDEPLILNNKLCTNVASDASQNAKRFCNAFNIKHELRLNCGNSFT